jgi:ferredoxin
VTQINDISCSVIRCQSVSLGIRYFQPSSCHQQKGIPTRAAAVSHQLQAPQRLLLACIFEMHRTIAFTKALVGRTHRLQRAPQFPVVRTIVKMTFVEEANQNEVAVEAKEGKSVLDIAIENNIDIEGACGGELACSTCHVILSQELFDKLPPKTEEEEDMLDLAWGLTDTYVILCRFVLLFSHWY